MLELTYRQGVYCDSCKTINGEETSKAVDHEAISGNTNISVTTNNGESWTCPRHDNDRFLKISWNLRLLYRKIIASGYKIFLKKWMQISFILRTTI